MVIHILVLRLCTGCHALGTHINPVQSGIGVFADRPIWPLQVPELLVPQVRVFQLQAVWLGEPPYWVLGVWVVYSLEVVGVCNQAVHSKDNRHHSTGCRPRGYCSMGCYSRASSHFPVDRPARDPSYCCCSRYPMDPSCCYCPRADPSLNRSSPNSRGHCWIPKMHWQSQQPCWQPGQAR